VQWKEASFTDKRGDVFRVYTVCNVDATVVDNWLRLPFVAVSSHTDVDDGAAVRLYVELRFTMRRCSAYPQPGRLQRCRESLKLLAYDAASDVVGNARRPTWDDRTYRTIGVVAADRVFADTADTSAVNTELRALQVRSPNNNNNNNSNCFTALCRGYPGEPVLQEKHSPTHHPDRPIFISFFPLPRSTASSLFKLRA